MVHMVRNSSVILSLTLVRDEKVKSTYIG